MAWRNVPLPEAVIPEIDRIVATGRYASRAEFVRAAVAEKLDKAVA